MRSARRGHDVVPGPVGHLSHRVREGPRAVEHNLRPYLELPPAVDHILDVRPDHPPGVAVLHQTRHPNVVCGDGARVRGGAREGHVEPGVVKLSVPVDDGALELGAVLLAHGRERGEVGEGLGGGSKAGHGQSGGARDEVVGFHSGPVVGHLPAVVARGCDREWMRQVRGVAEQVLALVQRLENELQLAVRELEHGLLQVPDAAVDELGGPRGGAAPEVFALDERRAQAPGGGVDRRARARSASSDDEHVKFFVRAQLTKLLASGRGRDGRVRPSLAGKRRFGHPHLNDSPSGGAHSGASGGTVSEEASSCHVNDRGRPRSVGLGSCGPALRRRRLGRRRCVVTSSSRKIILFGVVAFLNANWGLLNN